MTTAQIVLYQTRTTSTAVKIMIERTVYEFSRINLSEQWLKASQRDPLDATDVKNMNIDLSIFHTSRVRYSDD
jgi:hypothetical protein